MQTSNVCIYYNPKPLGRGRLLRAPFVELWPSVPGAKASVPGPAICPGRSFPKLLGAFQEVPGGLWPSREAPRNFPGFPEGLCAFFLKACPASEGEPARRLALTCDVFDERSQRVPRAPNLKPKEPRASAGPPALVSALASSEPVRF